MTCLTRLFVVALLFLGAWGTAEAQAYATGLLDSGPSSPNGSGSAVVGLDDQYALTARVAYLNLASGVASITLSLVKDDGSHKTMAQIPVKDHPESLYAAPDPLPVQTTSSFWDPNFLGDPTDENVVTAQNALKAALNTGKTYVSVNDASGNVEIQGQLAAPPAGAALRGFSLTPTNLHRLSVGGGTYQCYDKSISPPIELNRCIVPVYGYLDASNVCWTYVPFEYVSVGNDASGNPYKTRVIWVLDRKDRKDKGNDYFFTSGVNGVALDPSSAGVANDPKKDFSDPNNESGDLRRFKWDSAHKQKSSFPYHIVAEQQDRATGQTYPCQPADPHVTNE
jgi:hypothetical protein